MANYAEATYERRADKHSGNVDKTYRLDMSYDNECLVAIKHTELYGTPDNPNTATWNVPWLWTDTLIWNNGNIVELKKYDGAQYAPSIIRYAYHDEQTAYHVIEPKVLYQHHIPLQMSGIFGRNVRNLISDEISYDKKGDVSIERKYEFKLNDNRIEEYSILTHLDMNHSISGHYAVEWMAK